MSQAGEKNCFGVSSMASDTNQAEKVVRGLSLWEIGGFFYSLYQHQFRVCFYDR